MMSNMEQTQNYPIRPLLRGMVLDRASQHIEEDACRLAANYIFDQRGPRRRQGVALVNTATTVGSGEKFQDIATLWLPSGSQIQFLLSSTYLYTLPITESGQPVKIEGSFSEGTVTISGANVTLTSSGGDWSSLFVQVGDILRVGSEESVITELTATTAVIAAAADITDASGVSYEIVRTFDSRKAVDWEIVRTELVIADGKHPLQVFDPDTSSLVPYVDQPSYEIASGQFIARSIAAFNGRLWVGGTEEPGGDGVRNQRIRWSMITNSRDFSLDIAFQDFLDFGGKIIKLLPLGESLVAYAEDAILLGSPTNNPELPLRFINVNTGGRGLLGKHGVASWLDAHYFVTNDEIYQFSNEGLQPIGTPVERETIGKCEDFRNVYVVPDYNNNRVLFGFPQNSTTQISKMWSYNYLTQAWSYDDISTSMIANPLPASGLTWLDLAGFTWDDTTPLNDEFTTWRSMVYEAQDRRIYFERDGQLFVYTRGAAQDEAGGELVPIRAEYVTKDYDMDLVDSKKYWLRLGVKVGFDVPLGAPLVFSVEISNNRGRSYQSVGQIRIREGFDEGYVTFTKKSSLMRARITTTSPVNPFWIEEMVWKVRLGRHELTGGTAVGFSGGGDNNG
jgi:hypothetical protein